MGGNCHHSPRQSHLHLAGRLDMLLLHIGFGKYHHSPHLHKRGRLEEETDVFAAKQGKPVSPQLETPSLQLQTIFIVPRRLNGVVWVVSEENGWKQTSACPGSVGANRVGVAVLYGKREVPGTSEVQVPGGASLRLCPEPPVGGSTDTPSDELATIWPLVGSR